MRHKEDPTEIGAFVYFSSNFRLLSLAGELGFEPRLTESESAVLPLNYSPVACSQNHAFGPAVFQTKVVILQLPLRRPDLFDRSFPVQSIKRRHPAEVSTWLHCLPPASFFQIEYNPPHARSNILFTETEFGAHLQHAHVFRQHIAIHAPQTFILGVIDDTVHEQPAEPMTLEP